MLFVGPNADAFVAYHAITIAFNRWSTPVVRHLRHRWPDPGGYPLVIAHKSLAFAGAIPEEQVRGALVYPASDMDRSAGPLRGCLYCSWMDLTAWRA